MSKIVRPDTPDTTAPPFRCATLLPAAFGDARLTTETARAGGIGLLDAVHLRDAQDGAALHAVSRAAAAVVDDGTARLGLRLHADDLSRHRPLLDALAGRAHWILLCGWSAATLPGVLEALASPGRDIWLEIGAAGETAAVAPALPFAGWAARGAECGGLGGGESAFVLAQFLARQPRPFIVRGGIGPHAAAACLVAGAHAVVLDDVLWLLRESPLPPEWRHLVGRLGLTDTTRAGASHGLVVRVLERPEAPAGRALLRAEAAIDGNGSPEARRRQWLSHVAAVVGWGDPARHAWPVGEGIGQAAAIAARYRTTARLVRAVVEAAHAQAAAAARLAPLAPGAPLAASLGTRYPVVQGPMTRVSDRVEFADAVSAGGGLPLLALALMRGPEVATLVDSARDTLAGRAWGVGILGFVPPELRQEQMAVVERVKPPFALIAGGRPDQADALERQGIRTFLHVPAPLLAPFLAQGVRRFVFEGGECGGHVGPLHSFALWEAAVAMLVEGVAPADRSSVQVLFAGGIHDDLSGAMVSALAAPLAELGMQVGVLMGTAYLFTREAVEAGAITTGFQSEALRSADTVTIETGPGHVIRCAHTPFVDHFEAERRALEAQGLGGAALGDALEALIVGRSRIASKGLERDGHQLVVVDAPRQREDGLFMLGEVAAFHTATTTVAELHAQVASGSTAWLAAHAPVAAVAPAGEPPRPLDIAIVGWSCLVPGARDVETFWRNLLAQRPAIREIPPERWDWRLFYDPVAGARDRIASRWGGFVDPIPFDPLRFGIPPRSLPAITPPQLLALELTRRALVDAGFPDARPDEAVRARTTVVFGIGNTADLEQLYMTRAALPLIVPGAGEEVLARLPEWTEESYPGLLGAVVAGRVANRFDFGGPNLTIDAACASSLAALDSAVRELAEGRSDLAVAGGLEFEMSPQAFMGFSHTRALSPRGRADVFDAGADGIVISEGGVVLVLKRLADAERDGDRIYGVIKSMGASSDGRGLSMTAPKSEGQRRALDRAYGRAGIDPATLGLYEAHGTGTALGDAAEATTIGGLLRQAGAAPGTCAIGSAKSLIGHTRTAAGMVALLKATLALHHRTIPPHAGVSKPLAALAGDAPIYVADAPRPWMPRPDRPRRAGASAFGFGGTNFHVVVEEYPAAAAVPAPGGAAWPVELFVLSADDADGLERALERLDRAAARLDAETTAGVPSQFTLRDLAYVCAVEASTPGAARLAFTATTASELRPRIAAARRAARGATERDVFTGSGAPAGLLACVFPGQGSQYPGMGQEVATFVPALRAVAARADELRGSRGRPLAAAMWPPAAFDDVSRDAQAAALANTAVAQPAIGVVACGTLDVLTAAGVEPDAVAGHSYGEFVALHAAGALDRDALLRLSAARGEAMADVGADAGTMAMLALPFAEAEQYLRGVDGVVLANRNAPGQVVVSGTTVGVAAVVERVRADGHVAKALPVSGAFHSPLMAPARPKLAAAIGAVTFARPRVPVYANLDGQPYPGDPAAIAARLEAHLEQPVEFASAIEAMDAGGVRTFVEVGPGRVLSGLVRRTLGDRPFTTITTDGGLDGLLAAMARLFAEGRLSRPSSLFAGRALTWVDLDRLPPPSPAPAWFIDGAHVWPSGSEVHTSGQAPFLDADTAAAQASQLARRSPTDVPAVVVQPPSGPLADVYREYEQTMRRFLDQQERMLEQVLRASVGDLPPMTAGAPGEPRPLLEPGPTPQAPAAPADDTAVDRESLVARLVRIVGDRTGYGDDALDPGLDLEADLGIDSIKRIEIIGSFASSLPPAHADALKGELDRLTRLRTLGAIAEHSARALAGVPAAGAGDVLTGGADECRRFVIVPVEAPAPEAGVETVTGLHLVTDDRLGVAPHVAEALAARGAEVVRIPEATLLDPPALESAVADARGRHGAVRCVVHLAPLGRPASHDDPSWRLEGQATTRSLFGLLKLVAGDLANGSGATILAATGMGGDWGRTTCRPGAEMAGGCHGLLRSFEREHPDVRAVTVDLNEAEPIEVLAHAVVAEVLERGALREVGWRAGTRYVNRAEPAPLDDRAPDALALPEAGAVVLATGGTRGITAEICQEIAAPGVRFVLIGRGAPADGVDPAADERRRAVDGLRARGAEVEVVAADVTDAAAFGAAIEDVYRRHGRIDGVLHGAGVIHDQRFELKTLASFDRIFETKVGGALTLLRHLRPEGLRWVVLFGSVSGRFGNPGQTDYAAANEVLNRLGWTFRRHAPAAHVVTINWGPWRGLGMMSAATLALVEARGIRAIEIPAGRRFVAREIASGFRDEVEVVAGDGPWAHSGSGAVLVTTGETI
ncbi:MAG: SDR family NAD(P)-dependent oxidoreductase [Vicinamibacterales bacterium]